MAKKDATKFSYGVFDKKHIASIKKRLKAIDALFDAAITEGARIGEASGFKDPDKPFYLSDYSAVQERINDLMRSIGRGLQGVIETGDREEWLLSCEKNDAMVDAITSSTGLPKDVISHWKQPNLEALSSFQHRKEAGMMLSNRVWNITEQFKQELELALDLGLGEGKSAADLSRDVRKYLNEPNKLFRRVRDKHGVLRLSKAARAYHPGQGVYRSSYKNALRLTATENNMAYRMADSERWKQIPFVVGIRISISHNSHPVYDICDELQGEYPKDFVWVGWHPFCKCAAVAIRAKEEEFLDYQQKILAGEDVSSYKFSGTVKDVPGNFNAWLERNRERVKTTTTVPYFVKDNGKYIPKDWVDGIGSMAKGGNKGLITDIREAIIKIKDPTFITEKEVRTMIEKYAEAEPGDFYGGLKGVKMSKAKDGTMMCCERSYYNKTGAYAKENGNTIRIYNTDHHVIDPQGKSVVFNPLHEVKGAMRAIAGKTPLTFNQEYAIESLWHEIRHAGAVGWKDVRKKTPDLIAAMECINQFCARRSYGKLLRAIGGSVSHKKEIIKSGYGYSRSVRHFDEMLASMNISSSEAYAHFSKAIMAEPYEDMFGSIVKFLVGKGVKKQKAEMLIKALRHSDDMFGKILTGA